MSERVKLVVNRDGAMESEISLKKAEETLRMPISWQIPDAVKPFQNARIRGVPLSEVASGCRAHQAILEMARGIRPASSGDTEKPRKGLFAAFF
jgi:pilus assembly protein CpaE